MTPAGDSGSTDDNQLVVVPAQPGPLIRFASHSREADELDELIEELFGAADDERPGLFDIGLLLIGVTAVGWAAFGGGPTVVLVLGLLAIGLGLILPIRLVWRTLRQRGIDRRRQALLSRGVPLRLGHPVTDELAQAYDNVVGVAALVPEHGGAALRLAHVALVESATLLEGSVPATAKEQEYVARRAAAVIRLASALDSRRAGPEPDRATLVEAREQVDALAGSDAVQQIEELIAEVSPDRGDRP